MFEVMKIEIEETEISYRVCGIDLDKSHLENLFPGEGYNALAKYLCVAPFLNDRAEHFRLYHELTDSAVWALAKAPDIVHAIGIDETNMVPFMMMCMAQAGVEDAAEMAKLCHLAFGECNPP